MFAEDVGGLVKDRRCVGADIVPVKVKMHSAQDDPFLRRRRRKWRRWWWRRWRRWRRGCSFLSQQITDCAANDCSRTYPDRTANRVRGPVVFINSGGNTASYSTTHDGAGPGANQHSLLLCQ